MEYSTEAFPAQNNTARCQYHHVTFLASLASHSAALYTAWPGPPFSKTPISLACACIPNLLSKARAFLPCMISLLWDWGKGKDPWSLVSPRAHTCSSLSLVSSLRQQSHHEHGVSESQETGEGREESAVQRQTGICSFQGEQRRRKCAGLLLPFLCCSLLHRVKLQCPEGLDQWRNRS